MTNPHFWGLDSKFQILCEGFLSMCIQLNVFLNQVLFGLTSNFNPKSLNNAMGSSYGFSRIFGILHLPVYTC